VPGEAEVPDESDASARIGTAAGQHTSANIGRWLLGIASLAGFGIALGTLIPSAARGDAIEQRAWLAIFGIGYVLWRGLQPAAGTRLRQARIYLLALACVAGALNYYRYDSAAFTEVGDYYDITYYYLNSKYFDELGYYELYRAILLADEDNQGRLRGIRSVRDLHDYKTKSRATLMADTAELRARFTEARWAAFKHDADYVVRMKGASTLGYFFKDHGYNPPPTWTLVGGMFSKLTPVEHLKWITSIDTVLMLLAFGLVWRTFGLEAMLLGLLFMTTTLSGRWPVLGQALLRFDWLAACIAAMCCLHRGRSAWAGGLLAYAALSRIFPAIFFFAPLVMFARDAMRERRIGVPARRFVAAAAGVTALMVGGALLQLGGQAFADSAHNLAMHGSAESYSSLRVGLGDALIFRGERYWQLLSLTGSIPAKAEQLGALKPLTHAIGLLLLVLIGRVVWRRRGGSEPAMQLAYLAFFALTTPQINYHNSRVLLVIWHARGTRPLRDTVGLCCLLFVEVMGIATAAQGAITYTMTSMSSVGMTLYGLFIVGSLAWELRASPAATGAASAPRTAGAATLALAVMGCAWLGYWRGGALPAAELRLSAGQASEVQQSKTRWPRDGGRKLDALGVRVDLGRTHHARRIDVSVDHDDRDRMIFYSGDEVVGHVDFRGRRRDGRGRLSRRRVKVPEAIAARGYDAVRVVPMRGNRHFAFGHLVPLAR